MNFKRLVFNKITLGLLLIALAAGAYGWWQSRTAEVKYRTVEAKMADITQSVSANGTLKPVVLVNVGTQVSGTVEKLYVDFNDKVKQGQVLLELDPAVLNAQVQQTQANLASARASLDLAVANEQRAQTLFKQDYIARQDLDTAVQASRSARAQVDQINAQLVRDRTNLGYTIIRSPVSGVVVSRAVDLGQTVAASFSTPTLFQIAQDLRQMQIDTAFAEADIGSIKPGQPVQFTVDAFPNRNFTAAVKQVRLNATTAQNVVTYNVVVAVDNADSILLPSMTAYVGVVTAQRSNVLTVPNAALRFRPAGTPAPGQAQGQGATKNDRTAKGTGVPGAADTSGSAEGAGNGEENQAAPRQRRQATGGDATPAAGDTADNASGSTEKDARRRRTAKGGEATTDESGKGESGTSTANAGSGRRAQGQGGGQSGPTRGVVYVLDASNQLRRIPLRLGISDGRSTEVVGGEIKAGEQIVTGIEDTSTPGSSSAQGTFRMRLF